MYINEPEDYEHEQFFTQIDELICRCAEQGDGRVDINIQRQPSRSHSKYQYKICASNLFPYFSFISSKTLRVYLSKLQNRSTNRQAFEIFQQGLLNVVNQTGYGKIHLTFEKTRKEKIVFCEITVSRRHTI